MYTIYIVQDGHLQLFKHAFNTLQFLGPSMIAGVFLGSYYKTHSPAPTKELKKELDAFWRFQHPNLLTATSPSTWMGKEAAKSKWSNSNITTIQNPIPKNFFENKNVNGCKATLGLSTELPTVLVIAGNLNEERKEEEF